ncbi:hypothetical protein HGRIS_004236 [Hohenbuehelia grisea]|uniref:Uncharacterized protein n=1 Tax=Hohenbuehelia grisea TaxID=104357 RepID=A0ABR3IP61_9AGAR
MSMRKDERGARLNTYARNLGCPRQQNDDNTPPLQNGRHHTPGSFTFYVQSTTRPPARSGCVQHRRSRPALSGTVSTPDVPYASATFLQGVALDARTNGSGIHILGFGARTIVGLKLEVQTHDGHAPE